MFENIGIKRERERERETERDRERSRSFYKEKQTKINVACKKRTHEVKTYVLIER
jgi:hypothetical protein